jgi:hypothetical protein
MTESNAKLDTDVRWAQVPEWVVTAPISDRAVRLYALLARRANSDSQAFPSRKYLAVNMHCSSKSVDRAMEELLAVGAVTKQKQYQDSRQTVNLYTLRAMGGTPASRGGDTGDAGEGDTGVAQNESHKNESHKEPLAATPPKAPTKDDLFETVAQVCGISLDGITRTARGQLNKAVKELREVQATPEQIHHKAKAYRTQYPNATLTPTALTKHWSSFAQLERKQQRPSVWDTYEPPEYY